MMGQYRVRDANIFDVCEIISLKLSLQDHLHESNPRFWQLSQKSISGFDEFYLERIEDPDSKLVVVEDTESKELVGCGLGRILEHDEFVPEVSGGIDDVWIEPAHRRNGLCRKMISQLLRFFESRDVEALVLTYIEGNAEAQAVWGQLGFRTIMRMATATIADVK